MGGDKKQYQVLVDPNRLQEYDVSLQEVEAAIRVEQSEHQRWVSRRGPI